MSHLEEQLKSTELREPPAELRARVLKNAAAAEPEKKTGKKPGQMLLALASSKWFLFLILPLMLFAGAGVFALSVEERGAEKRWDEVVKILEDAGESLDFFAAFPEPVPDEENFMATPALAELELETSMLAPDHPRVLKYERLQALPDVVPPEDGEEGTDLAKWRIRDEDGKFTLIGDLGGRPEEAFLQLLEKDAGLFAELEQAARRPFSQTKTSIRDRLAGRYTFELSMGHFSALQKLAKLTSLRAVACARLDDREKARASLEILFKCRDCAFSDPMLINGLVGMTIRAIFHARLPDILREPCWTDDDLLWMQEKTAEGEGIREALRMFRGEMAASAGMYDEIMRMSGSERAGIMEMMNGGRFARSLGYWLPDGLFLRNKASSVQWMYEYSIVPLRDRDITGALESGKRLEAKLDSINWFSFGSILAKQSIASSSSIVRKMIESEIRRRMSLAAVALERYRRANGDFPANLGALVPRYLSSIPEDLCGEPGSSIGYELTGEGYRLFSTPPESGDDLEFVRR